RFAVKDSLHTLDPTIGYDEIGYYVLHPLFDTLVDFSPAGIDVVPRLARWWSKSPDGLVYVFELQPGIAFSDGAPITAAHFKFSLERALATADSPFAEFLADIAGAREVIEGKAAACAGVIAETDGRLVIRV